MTADDAQRDMRAAYFSGAPGMLASSLAWCVAGVVAFRMSAADAVVTLFAGGMLIHPVAVIVCKALGGTGRHSKANPLGALALENTVWMIFCLPLAYAAFLVKAQWFFPAMLLVIGGRYLTFHTLYGLALYWVCGATLAVAAYLVAALKLPLHFGAFVGAAIEAAFGAAITIGARRHAGT